MTIRQVYNTCVAAAPQDRHTRNQWRRQDIACFTASLCGVCVARLAEYSDNHEGSIRNLIQRCRYRMTDDPFFASQVDALVRFIRRHQYQTDYDL